MIDGVMKKFGWGCPEKPSSCKLELRTTMMIILTPSLMGLESEVHIRKVSYTTRTKTNLSVIKCDHKTLKLPKKNEDNLKTKDK